MPLLPILTFRHERFLDSVGLPNLTAVNSLLEGLSKMIPVLSRCSADATSLKCKVTADSYKSCSILMEESTVLYDYDEDLTVNERTTGANRKRRYLSQAYYISLRHD